MAIFARLREWFMLSRAQPLAARCPPERRADVRLLESGIVQRTRMAREAADEHYDAVTLTLLRQAVIMAASAALVGKGARETSEALRPAECATLIDEGAFGPPGSGWQGVRELVLSEDAATVDRLSALEARAKAADLLETLDWLRTGFESRTVRRIKLLRWLRIGGALLLLLAAIIGGVVWLLSPNNLARGKPVTASSHRAGTPAPSGVVDGVRTGTFGAHTDNDGMAWIMVDLLEPYALRQVVVYNRGDGLYEDMLPLVLELSRDGKEFQRASVREGTFTDHEPWRVTLNGEVARFVRLRVEHKHAYIALNEIEVFGKRAR